MNEAERAEFEQLIRDSGEGWILDDYHPRTEAIAFLDNRLQVAENEARLRFGDRAPPLNLRGLRQLNVEAPHKLRAFLQGMRFANEPALLIMVWRVLHGHKIMQLELNYQAAERFLLRIALGPPITEQDTYISEDILDAKLVSHIKKFSLNGAPVFDGFFPLQIDRSTTS
jgi:hypothetical protein